MNASSPLDQLAEAIEARRLDLELTWDELSAESGVHRETIRGIRARRTGSVRDLTKRGIEKALRWSPGSIDSLLAGGEPTPLADIRDSTGRHPRDFVDECLADPEFRAALDHLLSRMHAVMMAPHPRVNRPT